MNVYNLVIVAQNSLLPSKPFVKTARKTPLGSDRPKSSYHEPPSPRPSSARQKPRGSSATSMNKKWSSMEKNIEGLCCDTVSLVLRKPALYELCHETAFCICTNHHCFRL